ncbi:MAG: GH92 family glycosyl hydrolase [Acidobacteriaceae bacterium]
MGIRSKPAPRNRKPKAISNSIRRHIAACAALLALTGYAIAQTTTDPAASVDPIIGTGAGPGGGINLFPGATTPFGMVQLSPDTEDRGFGYHYTDTDIEGFSMTHMSGVGCPNEGDVFFTPTTGPIVTQGQDFQSPYSHKMESASPGYYQVQLLQWNINAELTATDHTGIARFTFPANQPANILLPLSHTLDDTAGASVHLIGDHEIEGYVENHAFCGSKNTYKVYFVMQFSRPFTTYGTWTGANYGGPGTIAPNTRTAEQTGHKEWLGAYATWPSQPQPQTITAKIGISYVDQAGAENNLKSEADTKDFSTIRTEARAAWNKSLSAIAVSGGTPADRKIFYTALYHSLLMPSLFDDADGRYMGFDNQIHTVPPGHHLYANYSGWDIYRDEVPLLALVAPHRTEDMARSIVLMAQQGGWIGRWPQINDYTNVMAGSPLTVALATTWLDGLHHFDINAAYDAMLQDATQAPPPGRPYQGEVGIEWINKLHYVPDDKVGYGSVSQLQEDAIAYASLYRLALALNKPADAKMFLTRAQYVRNVFNSDDHFFRPRNADGQWVPNFNPSQDSHGFIEGTGWHYQWFAPADMSWLIHATGRDLFNKRLAEFFNYPAPGWYAQFYNPYNETDLEAPFEFNFSGQPWQSQRVVRRVLRENYTTAPDGIPGNDDCGAMSSWAVLSMMGVYTVDPASLAYELVAPTFSKVTIHLREPYAGKTFTISTTNAAANSPYIQSATLNNQPHHQNWIDFQSITTGGTLHLTTSPNPNHQWGATPADAPPSLPNETP